MIGRPGRTKRNRTAPPQDAEPKGVIARLFDTLDRVVYVFIGVAFLVAALIALVISFKNLGIALTTSIAKAIAMNEFKNEIDVSIVLNFVSDLLLVLIVMEVLGTIRSYLDKGDATVRPFLFIGIISATRGILSIGALLSVTSQPLSPDEFRNKIIELGIDALVILALGITIRVMGDYADNKEATPIQTPKGGEDASVSEAEAVTVTTTIAGHHHEAQAGDASQR